MTFQRAVKKKKKKNSQKKHCVISDGCIMKTLKSEVGDIIFIGHKALKAREGRRRYCFLKALVNVEISGPVSITCLSQTKRMKKKKDFGSDFRSENVFKCVIISLHFNLLI